MRDLQLELVQRKAARRTSEEQRNRIADELGQLMRWCMQQSKCKKEASMPTPTDMREAILPGEGY
eukprot:4922064-Pleurochrysis_carterae.AAC.1